MNKRIMKKKYNEWETARNYNFTISFDEVPFIWTAWEASNEPSFQKFATSRNAMRAVKSYCKKYVWDSGACDNIKEMYHVMCEEIHNEREYRRRLNAFIGSIPEEDLIDVRERYEQLERVRSMITGRFDINP